MSDHFVLRTSRAIHLGWVPTAVFNAELDAQSVLLQR